MEHAGPAAQADAVPFLQGCRHADSARLLVRVRRQQPPAKNPARTPNLWQQPQRASRLRADFQRLVRGQNPEAEPVPPRRLPISPARRRPRRRRRGPPRRLPAQRPNLAAPLETLRPGPIQNPHGTGRTLSPAPTAHTTRAPTGGGASPRPSASRLPRRPLSHRRLSADTAHLLLVNRCPTTATSDASPCRQQSGPALPRGLGLATL